MNGKLKNLFATKKAYIVICAVVIILLLVITVVSLVGNNTDNKQSSVISNGAQNTNTSTNTADNSIAYTQISSNSNNSSPVETIANFDQTVRNIPSSERDAIYDMLNNTLRMNGVSSSIDDATIRNGSYSQSITDTNKMIYTTTFIIDIPSVKQSYVVQDMYSPLPPTESGLVDYDTLVLCPDESQLIYGVFDCTDRIKQERGYQSKMIKNIFKRVILLVLASFLCLPLSVLVSDQASAISASQRKIFNYSISYYNDCLTSGSSGIVAGNNKDYAGNPVFTDEELQKIEELSPFYIKAAEKYDMPWQILAVLHKRESNFYKGGPSNGQGPFQDYDNRGSWPVGDYDDETFQRACDRAAEEFKGKADGRDLNDPDNVKYAFFGYNGRAGVYKQQARNLGFDEEGAENGEGSPYVMNKADAMRDPNVQKKNGKWGQIKTDGGGIEYPANQDHGAFVMYVAIGGSNGGGTTSQKEDSGHYIWVGDSRTVGMSEAVSSGDNDWVGKVSAGYSWFTSDAINQVNQVLDEDSTIVFNFGVNDLGNVDQYISKLNELAKGDWSKAKQIIVMSVNPVDEAKASQNGYSVTNTQIEEFNKKMKSGLEGGIKFVDTYSQIKDQLGTTDGIHYDNDTYQKLYDMIRGTGVNSDAVCGESDTLSGTANEKIAQVAKEWGEWGSTYNACYRFGGGHTTDKNWVDKAIEAHFTGEYAVDCSGFASIVIYKATGHLGSWSTTTIMSDSKNFKVVDDPQPGDFAVSSSHVEVIVEVNDDGTFNTVGSHKTGCGEGYGASPGHFQGEKVYRYIGEGA